MDGGGGLTNPAPRMQPKEVPAGTVRGLPESPLTESRSPQDRVSGVSPWSESCPGSGTPVWVVSVVRESLAKEVRKLQDMGYKELPALDRVCLGNRLACCVEQLDMALRGFEP